MEKLSSNSLMCGDWVMVNDVEHIHPLQITEIYMKCGTPYVTLEWNGMPNEDVHDTLTADVDKVLPIPLTKEILEKNGFKVTEDGCTSWRLDVGSTLIKIYGTHDYHLSINIPTNTSAHGFRWLLYDLTIFYVHQLQQAMRIFRIDKKIEL